MTVVAYFHRTRDVITYVSISLLISLLCANLAILVVYLTFVQFAVSVP